MRSRTLLGLAMMLQAGIAPAACMAPTQEIFVPAELLKGFSPAQDSDIEAPPATDAAGQSLAPVFAWIKVWSADGKNAAVASLRDIKVALPTSQEAQGFREAEAGQLSEGAPQVARYAHNGTDVTVYGPTPEGMPSLGPDMPQITAYTYVSVTQNVVSKVFVMQGLDAATPLTPEDGKPYANAAIDGIAKACK